MNDSDGPLESIHVLTNGPKVIPFRRESRDTEKAEFFAAWPSPRNHFSGRIFSLDAWKIKTDATIRKLNKNQSERSQFKIFLW